MKANQPNSSQSSSAVAGKMIMTTTAPLSRGISSPPLPTMPGLNEKCRLIAEGAHHLLRRQRPLQTKSNTSSSHLAPLHTAFCRGLRGSSSPPPLLATAPNEKRRLLYSSLSSRTLPSVLSGEGASHLLQRRQPRS